MRDLFVWIIGFATGLGAGALIVWLETRRG